MPLPLPHASTMLIRRAAFDRAGLTRGEIDQRFGLTDEEFRVEGELIVVGPLVADDAPLQLTDLLESRGLQHFEDFFDLSGAWPDWLLLFAMVARGDATSAE